MTKVALILLLLFSVGCVTQKYYGPETSSYAGAPDKSLRSQLVWTKNKTNSFHIMIRLVNEYSEPIVLKTILLEYEGVKVAPTDAVPIELQPGQTMEKLMIFQASNRRPVPTGADLSATLSANVYQGTPEKLVQALHSLRKTFPYCREGNIVCP